jgi:hypothetical protein
MRFSKILFILISCAGCLDRSDTEQIGYSSFIREPGVEVRPLERTMAAKMKLDANDGLSSPVQLRTGYAAGREVKYWDLGQAPTSSEPMWIFLRNEGDDPKVIEEHPPVIDNIPGDTGYTPVRLIFWVYVTSRYGGEQFTSPRAIEDGIELGLLEEPIARDIMANCVVTLEATKFETDREPLSPTPAYYRDRVVFQFCAGGAPGTNSGAFATRMGTVVYGNAYVLRREDEAVALDEGLFKSDLNMDGDMLDSNVVFDSVPGEAAYTSLWKNYDVVVSPDYNFGELQAQDQMFEKKSWGLEAKSPQVIRNMDTTLILNRPQYTPEAAP